MRIYWDNGCVPGVQQESVKIMVFSLFLVSCSPNPFYFIPEHSPSLHFPDFHSVWSGHGMSWLMGCSWKGQTLLPACPIKTACAILHFLPCASGWSSFGVHGMKMAAPPLTGAPESPCGAKLHHHHYDHLHYGLDCIWVRNKLILC